MLRAPTRRRNRVLPRAYRYTYTSYARGPVTAVPRPARSTLICRVFHTRNEYATTGTPPPHGYGNDSDAHCCARLTVRRSPTVNDACCGERVDRFDRDRSVQRDFGGNRFKLHQKPDPKVRQFKKLHF